jgi:hypothetical protein
MPNHVLNKMMEFEGELTWERYLEFAYLGDPPKGELLVEDFAEFQRAIKEQSREEEE